MHAQETEVEPEVGVDDLRDFLYWTSQTDSDAVDRGADLHIAIDNGLLDDETVYDALFADRVEVDSLRAPGDSATAHIANKLLDAVQGIRRRLPQLVSAYLRDREKLGDEWSEDDEWRNWQVAPDEDATGREARPRSHAHEGT